MLSGIDLWKACHHIHIWRETLIERVLSLEGWNIILLLNMLTFSLVGFLVNLNHQILITVFLPHLVELSRRDVILAVDCSSIHIVLVLCWLRRLLTLLESFLSQFSQLLCYRELLFVLIIILLHPLLHDGCRFPHLIFWLNFTAVGIYTHAHVH